MAKKPKVPFECPEMIEVLIEIGILDKDGNEIFPDYSEYEEHDIGYSRSQFKKDILVYINNDLGEEYTILDIFKDNTPDNGELTKNGFEVLKNLYEFHETKVKLGKTVGEYIKLKKIIEGMYYLDRKQNALFTTSVYVSGLVGLSGDTMLDILNGLVD